MIIYAHGREGTPWGAKVTGLRAAGYEVYAPDLRELNLAARISRIEDALKHHNGLLVASSYSGLAAVVLARRTQLRIHRLVLLAPAMHVYEPPASTSSRASALAAPLAPVDDPDRLVLPETVQTVIVHGTLDENVPVDFSRRLAARSGPHVRLIEVEDTHRLGSSMPTIIQAVRGMIAA